MTPLPRAGRARFVQGFLLESAQSQYRRNHVKSLSSLRLMAWSLALIAVVFAVFLPLGYWQLRKLAHRGVPPAPMTQPVEPAAEMPAPGAPAPPSGPCSESPSDNLKQPGSSINLGDFYLRRGDYDCAISAYQQGLKLDPSNSDLRQKLDSAIKTCKQENAILNEGLKCGAPSTNPPAGPSSESQAENPKPPYQYISLGDFHVRRGEYDDAINAYQQGLKVYPSNPDLRQKLDAAIKSCKQEDAVLNSGYKCGAPSPNSPPPVVLAQAHAKYGVLGDFHMARGEYDDAIRTYQEGLKHYPSSSELQQKLDNAIKTCKQENAVLNTNSKCGAP